MSYIITNNKHYKNIASAIRSKLRVETKYTPEEMASAIGNIPSSADGTDTPVAGIYYTDPDENGNPTIVKLVGLKSNNIPNVFTTLQVQKTLKRVKFINCHFTEIPDNLCRGCSSLEYFLVPEGTTSFGNASFRECSSLESLKFPDSIRKITGQTFYDCINLTNIDLSNIVTIGFEVFFGCKRLKNVFFPNTLKTVGIQAFDHCSSLTNITLENNFDCNNLNISSSSEYTRETMVSWFNALKDRTGESSSYKLTIGNQNLKKLTSEDIAIANNKNWTIV